ncbi:hypothetical protein FZEAL_10565 [Fusarium zealandicum]|uniref:Uncharacterized protein n=1 Tax=Fusarium zealandicum TaxID=1053134 RepID=A0A8H4X9R6_9HYPO|nr:hypothetical protein FZEAL_10565 [Fusarium zealandicum]
MPTYLCHGFRWHRRAIRIFVILNDLEDAASNWIIAPATSSSILSQFYTSYDFLPKPAPPTALSKPGASSSIKAKSRDQHLDDDHSLPPPRVPHTHDGVLMHSWSSVKLLEEFDADETITPCRPYAYVADFVVRVDLSVDVAGEMAKYYDKMAGDDGWIVKIRDHLQKGEPVRWYVVVCGDEVREVPGDSDDSSEYSNYHDDDDDDDALTALEDIPEEAEEPPTPKPLDEEEPEIFRPLRPGDSDDSSEYSNYHDDDDDALTALEDIPEEAEEPPTPKPLEEEEPETRPGDSDDSSEYSNYHDDDDDALTALEDIPEEAEEPPTLKPLDEEEPEIYRPLRPGDLAPPRSPSSTTTSSSGPLSAGAANTPPRLPTPDVDMPLLQPNDFRASSYSMSAYSTSTTSGLYQEDDHLVLEAQEFAMAQSPAWGPCSDEISVAHVTEPSTTRDGGTENTPARGIHVIKKPVAHVTEPSSTRTTGPVIKSTS